jgi:hypothetical protein
MQVRKNRVFVPGSKQCEAVAGEETRRRRRDGLPGQHWVTRAREKLGNELPDVKGNDDDGRGRMRLGGRRRGVAGERGWRWRGGGRRWRE